MRQSTLQRVLVAPLILLALALAGVIYWSSQRSSENTGREFSQKLLLNLVERVKQNTSAHLVGARVAVDAVAPNAIASPADQTTRVMDFPRDAASIEMRLWIATGFFPTVNNYVYFGGADGRFIGLNRRNDRIELRSRAIGQSQREIWSVAAPGQFLSLVKRDQYDPRTRPWYVKTIARGRESWSDVYTDFTTLEPVFTLSKPIYQADKTLVGVVSTDLSLTQISNFFQSLTVSRHGIAYVVEQSGAVIATSTAELPYRAVDKKLVRLEARQSASALLRESYEQVKNWQRDGATLADPVSREFQSAAGPVQVGATVLRDPAGLEWVIVVAAPRADFTGNVTEVMYQSMGIGLLAVAMVMLIGFLLLQWVLRDIGKLTRAAEDIGMGKPHSPLNILRSDEIGLLAKSFQQMERNLRTDKLTGALNRETLVAQIAFRQRNATEFAPLKFSLLFLDLDLFKPVNDEHGHEAGDKVLIETCRRLHSGLRGDDDVARFGGDEFVVYLHGINTPEQVQAVIGKIAKLIQVPYELRHDLLIRVDASIGWASYPGDGADTETLLRVADTRMFAQKKTHANR